MTATAAEDGSSSPTVCPRVTQATLSGIFRGLGKQLWGAVTNVVGYYVVGASVIAVTVLRLEYEVKGLWLGLFAGTVTQCALMALLVRWTGEVVARVGHAAGSWRGEKQNQPQAAC